MNPVWFMKHRPSQWSDVVGQDVIVAEMEKIANGEAGMQHYLFFSEGAGTGKTSIANLLAEKMGYTLHIYNASSKRTRGIEFIEEEIIPLSQSGVWETIILLDEADRLTIQAQDALKGVIEQATCYFILTCNDLNKVSPWLQSRCQVRTFNTIDTEKIIARLSEIAGSEQVNISQKEIQHIAKAHEGDMRNAIGCLQAYHALPESERDKFLKGLSDRDFEEKRFLRVSMTEKALTMSRELIGSMSLRPIIKQVFEFACSSGASEATKMKVIEASIVSERDLLNGVDEEIVKWNYCRLLTS